MPRVLPFAACALVVLVPAVSAADQKEECVSSYTRSQELRGGGKLREAREQLLACAQAECPDFIKRDCSKWLNEVDATLPTVVFSAKHDGKDVTNVRVTSGDKVIAESLDGRAVPWDPGATTFVFESGELGNQEVTLTVNEGQKAQAVEAVFGKSNGAGEVKSGFDSSTASDKTLAYVLGGVGILGVGAFAFLGSSGNSDKNSLSCADTKTCTDDDLDPIKKKYLFADISLGVGVVSLGVATYLLLKPSTPSEPTQDSAKSVHFDVVPSQRGGFAAISGQF